MANSLRFITGIRYHKDMLERLNNITYIYDNNWDINNSNKATFPVAFFHVKSFHEAMTAEVSQKQMLFYNSDVDENKGDPAMNSGLLNIVADNIVIKPKVYKLDVIIPYRNLTLLNQSFVYNTHTAHCINTVMVGKEPKIGEMVMQAYAGLNQPYVRFLASLLKALVGQSSLANLSADNTDNVDTWVRNITHQPDYNKQSLELMWKLRRIVKMKMWNSWEYKYVSIVDMDITKEGTEDGVYEATLTVQEMPIVTMYSEKTTKATKSTRYTRKNPLLEVNAEIAKTLLDKAGGEFSGKKGASL